MKIKITERKSNIIEGIGLLLILFSFLIQLMETDIESEVREAQFRQTQTKLDHLWMVISDDYAERHPEENVFKAISLKNIDDEWKYYSENKSELSDWQNGVLYGVISKSRIWIFIIGSFLVVIPKFIKKES
ncbi:hypothetical protein HZP48_00615 [Elizabethkingia anophelis]|nr:hypothetical protein [Elizabethkingia anophelis]MCT4217474.1 hypothetical protein [Elizabethkingia anophelis]